MNEKIIYDFQFEDGRTFHFEIPLQGWVETPANRDAVHPEWTRLENDKCPNCPLSSTTHRYCPAAVDIHEAAKNFSAIASYQNAKVTVLVGTRTYSSTCDMNTGLRSLFGLYMALSGCPVTSRMRPMALRHQPFSSMQETLGRAVRSYLQKQYYIMKAGGIPDWELKGLLSLYDELDTVNSTFIKRLRRASERDSNLNAICGFATFARAYTFAFDELMEEEKRVFMDGF
jgi:hypothetical protein